MAEDYMVSLREASKILNKKPSTVRAYVRAGRLSKQYVDGFNGKEMRLSKKEVEDLAPLIKTDENLLEIEKKQENKQTPKKKNAGKVADNGDVLAELLDERLTKEKKSGNSPVEKVATEKVVPDQKSKPDTTVSDPAVSRALELLEAQISELRKEKEELRQESKALGEKNFQMAGQLGYFQNQVETLKDQVKQLTAPAKTETSRETGRKAAKKRWFGLFGAR